MIISTGNNFGVGSISFKSYQTETLLMLNGKVQIDPTDSNYLAASILEIYVPDLLLSKSAISAVFLVTRQPEGNVGTILKTWIKDRNTICIERAVIYDSLDNITLYFACAYTSLGQRNTLEVRKRIETTYTDKPSTVVIYEGCFYTEDCYCALIHGFRSFYYSSPSTEFNYTINELPTDIDLEFPMFYEDFVGTFKGTAVVMCKLHGRVLTCEGVPAQLNYSFYKSFYYLFCVRDSTT